MALLTRRAAADATGGAADGVLFLLGAGTGRDACLAAGLCLGLALAVTGLPALRARSLDAF